MTALQKSLRGEGERRYFSGNPEAFMIEKPDNGGPLTPTLSLKGRGRGGSRSPHPALFLKREGVLTHPFNE